MSQFKVVLIDRDVSVAMDLRSRLERMGCDVSELCNPSATTLQSIAVENSDVVLMNVSLGEDINALSLAEDVCRTLDVPVIFVTDSSDDLPPGQDGKIAPCGFLVKPIQDWDLQVFLSMALFQRSKEQDFYKLFQNSPNGVMVLRYDEKMKNFIVEAVNSIAMQLDEVEEDMTGQIMAAYMIRSVGYDLEGQGCFELIEAIYRVWKTGEPELYTMTIVDGEFVDSYRKYFIYQSSKNEVTFLFRAITQQR